MKIFTRTLCGMILGGIAMAGFAQAPIERRSPSDGSQQPQAQYPQGQEGYPPPQDQGQYPPQQQQGAPDQSMDQQPGPPPPPIAPQQLDQLVARIALYPDPLLAQTLTAATFGDEIPDAAGWADQHNNLTGDALGQAIDADNLPWDPSVLALLPFPSVLDMMANDPNWTAQLGDAVLAQRQDVMDAVQRQREQARNFGYLTTNTYDTVTDDGGYVAIQPNDTSLYYVPLYDPAVVFFAPRPGFYVRGAIRFGPAVTIGTSFSRFGWFGAGFGWSNHAILIDHRQWGRTWVNRGHYVHPYAHPYVAHGGPYAHPYARPAGRPYARPATPRVERHSAAPAARSGDHRR